MNTRDLEAVLALAGLGVEAGMTARVLLWADWAAFALGAVTTVINEHRGEIIARFGDPGRQLLRYVDIVNSATAMYGFARLVVARYAPMAFSTITRSTSDTG